jgi:hypothetical protein
VDNHFTSDLPTTMVTTIDLSIIHEHMGKEANDGLKLNESVRSSEALITSTLDHMNGEILHGDEEDRSDANGDSHLLPNSPENPDTTTLKRGIFYFQ